MKIKYKRLSKAEKKDARKKYFSTKTGLYVKKKLLTSLICSILCLIIAIYLFLDTYFNSQNIWLYIYSSIIFIFGIAFIIFYRIVLIKKVNDYLTK